MIPQEKNYSIPKLAGKTANHGRFSPTHRLSENPLTKNTRGDGSPRLLETQRYSLGIGPRKQRRVRGGDVGCRRKGV